VSGSPAFKPALARLDRKVLRVLRTRAHSKGLERAMVAYTTTGEMGALWIAIALAGAALDDQRRGSWLAAAALVPASMGANFLVKVSVRRHRPRLRGLPPVGRTPSTYSFPSAHAVMSFAGATAIGAIEPAARTPLMAAAVLMAVSRSYLGVHYPSDVLTGAALGRAIGLAFARAI
jgi:membrane-associated phospholipid phosphatase